VIKSILLAGILSTISAAGAGWAQVGSGTPGSFPPGAPATDTPILGVAQPSPDCGNLAISGRAFCVTAPLASIDALAGAYDAHFTSQGWIAADGAANRVVFVRRRDGGGCDGLQMVAFYDTAKPATADAPGYLGFATVPGNVCASETPAATPNP